MRALVASPRRAGTWAWLGLLAAGAVATVAVMVWAAGYGMWGSTGFMQVLTAVFSSPGMAMFVVWALVPFAAMAALVVVADRRAEVGRAVRAVVAAGVVAVVALGGWALVDFVTSESSTAALVFIFLPFYQLVVAAACAAIAVGVHALGRRRHRRRAARA